MLKDLIRVLKGELSSAKLDSLNDLAASNRLSLDVYRETNARLIATIREMDQTIWTMGQQPSWERMRPYYLDLQMGMNERKKIENDRIRGLMVGEIVEAYNTDPGGITPVDRDMRPLLEKKS